jgi:hypothetical protein
VGNTLTEILEEKTSPISLKDFYKICKKNPELEKKVMEARKYGVQTLIDRLMNVFNQKNVDSPNAVLWIRERTKFIQWLGSKLTDIYSDNKPQQVKTDQVITVKFETGIDEPIELDPGEYEYTPEPVKGKD